MTMHTLTTQQRQVLGLDTLSSSKRMILMERIGRTVFDNALVRLLETLTDEQIYALNYALEDNDSPDAVFMYLQKNYPQFVTYLEETQKQFVASCIEQMHT